MLFLAPDKRLLARACAGTLIGGSMHGAMQERGLNRQAPKRGHASNRGPRKGRAEAIMGSAFRLFAEQGYPGISIKDIARACGINSALIYYYFDNKEHLFVETLKHAVESASAGRHSSAGAPDDPVTELNLWFDANETLAKPLGQMLRLMLDYRASRRRSPPVERLIRCFYATELGLLRSAIRRGTKAGLFRPVHAGKLSLFVSTHLDGLVAGAAIRPDFDLRAGLRHMRTVLFTYLEYEQRGRNRAAARPDRLQMAA
jgi:AcrR family transcriptional regulator